MHFFSWEIVRRDRRHSKSCKDKPQGLDNTLTSNDDTTEAPTTAAHATTLPPVYKETHVSSPQQAPQQLIAATTTQTTHIFSQRDISIQLNDLAKNQVTESGDDESETEKIRRHQPIILGEDIVKFWRSGSRDQFFKSQSWYRERENFDMGPWLKILSILILIKFQDWDSFARIFLETNLVDDDSGAGKRCDQYLPFKKSDLENGYFLGRDDGRRFYEDQWILCPLVIEERSLEHQLSNTRQRLPFIEPSVPKGSGAAGEVTVEVVAPYHLRYTQPDRPSTNYEKKLIACKRVRHADVQKEEIDNLKRLRQCLSQNSRIMINIATILHIEPISGPVHLILYDLAEFDLDNFLRLSPTEWRKQRHESIVRGRNDSLRYWEGDLIDELHNLADALRFLHDEIYIDKTMGLVHNDLKPANILVFFPNSSDKDAKYPVGLWKIADFGLSRMKNKRVNPRNGSISSIVGRTNSTKSFASAQGSLTVAGGASDYQQLPEPTHRHNSKRSSLTSLSNTKAKRDPGRFTAPEMEGGTGVTISARKADIWSFGGIFAVVLAYAVSYQYIHELSDISYKRSPANQPDYLTDRFYDDKSLELKESIACWLSELPRREPASKVPSAEAWIGDSVKLIKDIMKKEPESRPSAREVRNNLQAIKRKMTITESLHPKDDGESDPRLRSQPSFHSHYSESPPHSPTQSPILFSPPHFTQTSRSTSTPAVRIIGPD